MPETVIRLRAVSKHYGSGAGRQQVLYDVSCEVMEGELVAVVGTSGSGKSTLLNIVGGLDRQYTGEVAVLGADYRTMSDWRLSQLRNAEIGFIFQSFNLLDHMNCWENVALPSFFGRRVPDAEARAREQLERVGLGARLDAKPGNLSGGQKQRVGIARALFHRPKLLLCDEPTGNLDSRTGAQIIDLFSELNQADGLTIVIVTHEQRVSKVAHRMIQLEDGRIIRNDERDPQALVKPDVDLGPALPRASGIRGREAAPSGTEAPAEPPAETPERGPGAVRAAAVGGEA